MTTRTLGALIIILATACGTMSCASSSVTSPKIDSGESGKKGPQWELSHFSGIPVRIAWNNVSNDSLLHNRKILMLLEEEYFGREDLKKVFAAIAAQYADPEFLIITALSDREMLRRELEKNESLTYYFSPEGASLRQPEESPNQKIPYFRAYYLRMHDEERLGYSFEPEKGRYTTIYLRHREIPYTGDIDADLLLASEEGDTNKVKALLSNGASVEARDQNGNTSIVNAALGFHTEIVNLLLSKGANVNAADENGNSALIYAAAHGQSEIVDALLERGADPNALNSDGDSALIRASCNGHPETVLSLLSKGTRINMQNNEKWTALMSAVANGNVEIVQILLANGADVDAKNNKNQTALMMAKTPNRNAIIELLKRAGAEK